MGAGKWTVDRWPEGSSARRGIEACEVMECSECGLVATRGDTQLMGVSCRDGIDHLAWPDCSPREHVILCPHCGRRESFGPAVVCAECSGRPCACDTDQDKPSKTTPSAERT